LKLIIIKIHEFTQINYPFSLDFIYKFLVLPQSHPTTTPTPANHIQCLISLFKAIPVSLPSVPNNLYHALGD